MSKRNVVVARLGRRQAGQPADPPPGQPRRLVPAGRRPRTGTAAPAPATAYAYRFSNVALAHTNGGNWKPLDETAHVFQDTGYKRRADPGDAGQLPRDEPVARRHRASGWSAACRPASASRASGSPRSACGCSRARRGPGGCSGSFVPWTPTKPPPGQSVSDRRARARPERDRPVERVVEAGELVADVELAAAASASTSVPTPTMRREDRAAVALQRRRQLRRGRRRGACGPCRGRRGRSRGTQPVELFGRIGSRTRYHVCVALTSMPVEDEHEVLRAVGRHRRRASSTTARGRTRLRSHDRGPCHDCPPAALRVRQRVRAHAWRDRAPSGLSVLRPTPAKTSSAATAPRRRVPRRAALRLDAVICRTTFALAHPVSWTTRPSGESATFLGAPAGRGSEECSSTWE